MHNTKMKIFNFCCCYLDVTHESSNGLGVCLAIWPGVYSKVSSHYKKFNLHSKIHLHNWQYFVAFLLRACWSEHVKNSVVSLRNQSVTLQQILWSTFAVTIFWTQETKWNVHVYLNLALTRPSHNKLFLFKIIAAITG